MDRVRVRERIEEMAGSCDVEIALVVIGGKWKMLILKYLSARPHRFGELQRALPPITQRMLTRQLRDLEKDSLVLRTAYAEAPPRTEYSLTPIGSSLERLIDGLDTWGAWYRGELVRLAEFGTGPDTADHLAAPPVVIMPATPANEHNGRAGTGSPHTGHFDRQVVGLQGRVQYEAASGPFPGTSVDDAPAGGRPGPGAGGGA